MESSDVKMISSDQVVGPVGTAKTFEPGFGDRFDRRLSEVLRHAERKGKVANPTSDDLFEVTLRPNHFVTDRCLIRDIGKVDVVSRVTSDLDTRVGHLSDFVDGIDCQWFTTQHVVLERSLTNHIAGGHKVRAWDSPFNQQGNRRHTIVSVPIIKGDR